MRTSGLTKIVLLLVTAALLASALPAAGAQAAGPVNYKLGTTGIVCLTIDDGFSRQSVEHALATLRKYNVKCTFFIVGAFLRKYADLWRQAVKDGHEICYHSMKHSVMTYWSETAIRWDVREWNLTARSVLGEGYYIPRLARLPGGGGHGSERIQKIFSSMGYRLIQWSADTYTGVYRTSTKDVGNRIASFIRSTTKPNSIILTHFNGCDTPALDRYLGWLKSHFTLGRVSEAFPRPSPKPSSTPAPPPGPVTMN